LLLVSVEIYPTTTDDEAGEVPDKLELNFQLDDNPIQFRLVRSDSIPTNPTVTIGRDDQHISYEPTSVNAALLL